MTTRHLRPHQHDLVVVLVRPGETVTVETERGPEEISGMHLADYPEARLALVPYSPAAVGWGETHLVSHGVGPAQRRTPTGLTASLLRRILRGHKLDEDTWADARRLLGEPGHAVYVRMGEVGYYSRKRIAAIEARTPEEAS